ncbi:MAG: ion channel, partial [Bacteroidota bacterium]
MATNSNKNDLGFGTRIARSGDRLIKKDGSFNIVRDGNVGWNTYQLLIKLSSGRFAIVATLFFVGINAFFALLFLLVGIEQLVGVPEGNWLSDFLYAFFFSVQTFTTVGYGAIHPMGIAANIVATVCAGVGLISFALITGIFFARFSRPRSHISFSQQALISPY